jgi:hypothetical protein
MGRKNVYKYMKTDELILNHGHFPAGDAGPFSLFEPILRAATLNPGIIVPSPDPAGFGGG